jgi:photosystem II stability/assembly factor-like uncharacterized protein
MSRPASRTGCAALLAVALAATLGCHNFDFSSRYGSGEIDIFDDLFSVAVVDESHVVAVGYQGAAYYSEDGGESWHKGKVPTNRLLYSVSMANKDVGWAVGQLGTILRTEDGGHTWTLQPNLKVDEATHLFGVEAIDDQTAIAVGEWGGRISTNDGGKTWNDNSLTVGLDHPQFVWLSFDDQERVRQGKKVYEDVSLQDVYCLPGGTRCWLIGEFGYVYISADRGQTWEKGEIQGDIRIDPIELKHDQLDLDDADRQRLTEFAERIEDQQHLNVLIDVTVDDREIAKYYDKKNQDPEDLFDIISARLDETKGVIEEAGLMSDRLRMYNKPPWDYQDFLEHDSTFLDRYVEGRRSENHGPPMIKVSVIQNPFLFTVRFNDEQHGLISGLGGVILRSEDGGKSWTYVETSRRQALFAVDVTDGKAVAVGEKGLVQYSVDDGKSWAPPAEGMFPQIFTFMRDLGFARTRRSTGFIVGQDGMVLRSQDSGATWTQVLPPPDRRGPGSKFS